MKIINIRSKTVTPGENQLLKNAGKGDRDFQYGYIPVVVYNEKIVGGSVIYNSEIIAFNDMSPFTLYEFGTPLTLLKSYTSGGINEIIGEDLLSVRTAFSKLKSIASHCYERIIADLTCDIILKKIKKYKDDIVFFIEKTMSDKILGHLGTLYLDLSRITIVFLSINPSDLMTIAMGKATGKLRFDIHRLMSENEGQFFGPYPEEPEGTLVQSYFLKPRSKKNTPGKYRPIRLDVFSQGLGREAVDKKREILEELFNPDKGNVHEDVETNEPKLLVPDGFQDLKKRLQKIEFELLEQL